MSLSKLQFIFILVNCTFITIYLAAPPVEKPKLAERQSLPHSATEKTNLSPRQSSPLSSPRQPTVTTNPNATIILSRKPVAKPRSIPLQQSTDKLASPVAPKATIVPSQTPTASPRSPIAMSKSPVGSSRMSYGDSNQLWQQPSSSSASSASPVASPRQQQSPRTPPPVAPKPRRTASKKGDIPVIDDPTKPIEVELFVSINSANENLPNKGHSSILPGSVNYDVVQNGNASTTKWTAGLVSSLDLKNTDTKSEREGNLDVVNDTETPQTHVVVDTETPETDFVNYTERLQTHVVANPNMPETDVVDTNNKHVNDRTVDLVSNEIPADSVDNSVPISDPVDKLNNLESDIDSSQVDVSLLSNRSRTFSTSSNASSYTEFTECNVEDDNIPADIAEEEENNGVLEKQIQDKDNEYESDFEDEENEAVSKTKLVDQDEEIAVQSPDSGIDMNRLKSLAENIVSDVILSIRQSDFNAVNISEDKIDEDEAPPIPKSLPPTVDDIPLTETQLPPLPEGPPPMPYSDVPSAMAEVQPGPEVPAEALVVDLALYPDSDQSSDGTTDSQTEHVDNKEVHEVIDIVDVSSATALHATAPISSKNVDISLTTTLHATAPISSESVDKKHTAYDIIRQEGCENDICDKTENVNSVIIAGYNDDAIDASLTQVTDDSNGLEGDGEKEVLTDKTDAFIDNIDCELSVSNVISMYSNLEKSLDEQNNVTSESKNEANNNNIEKDDSVSLHIDQHDSCDTKSLTSSEDFLSDVDSVNELVKIESPAITIIQEPEINKADTVTDTNKVNGHADSFVGESRKSTDSDKSEPLSPRSAPESPKSEVQFKSRVDRILSETEEMERGKCSPEIDRMVKSKLNNSTLYAYIKLLQDEIWSLSNSDLCLKFIVLFIINKFHTLPVPPNTAKDI